MLEALDHGAGQLIGIEGLERATSRPSTPVVRPLTIDELRPALRERYLAELQQLPERARVDQLTRWGEIDPGAAKTQKTLMRLWKLSQGAVSNALAWFTTRLRGRAAEERHHDDRVPAFGDESPDLSGSSGHPETTGACSAQGVGRYHQRRLVQ